MKLPRWSDYAAIGVLLVLALPAVPGKRKDPNAGAALAARGVAVDRAQQHERVVVLGIDGLDPDLLREVLERYPERTRNLQWVAGEHGEHIHDLGTALPPQSPVAWSDFITGMDAGGHGIYDFIHRDPTSRGPIGSTTRHDPGSFFGLIGAAEVTNRSGRPFWQRLMDAGVPADVWRMPANYPVEKTKGWSFPGMMTPAIDSAYGESTLYTSDSFAPATVASEKIEILNRSLGDVVHTRVLGPEKAPGERATAKLTIYVDAEAGAVCLDTGSRKIVLEPGEWSDFANFSFDMGLTGGSLAGVARFYLRSIEPELELYCSPVNIDPRSPVTPVSQPESASADLADAIGTYYTQGMAEDVNALKDRALTDAEFLDQSRLVYVERGRMLEEALDRFVAEDGGLLFFYYSTVDLMSHMVWRHADPEHPAYDPELADDDTSAWSGRPGSRLREVIDDIYLSIDPVVGRLRERLGDEGWTLMLMSDHGFAPYHREFSLNTWLLENGYLATAEPVWARPAEAELAALTEAGRVDEEGYLLDEAGARIVATDGRELDESDPAFRERNILTVADWSQTRAYGVGFNGLYLNLRGRELDDPSTPEDESGVVDPAEADALLRQLKGELEAIVDPKTGERVILRADIAREAYVNQGRIGEAPDILVGFNSGYGNADDASVGRVPSYVLRDNTGGTFNGHHLMAPEVVPGLLLSNREILPGDHNLRDLTVEVLSRYGVDVPEELTGHRVLAD